MLESHLIFGECGVDSGVIQLFVFSQSFCMNKASPCLSILSGERAVGGRGQGKEKRAEKPGAGRS